MSTTTTLMITFFFNTYKLNCVIMTAMVDEATTPSHLKDNYLRKTRLNCPENQLSYNVVAHEWKFSG